LTGELKVDDDGAAAGFTVQKDLLAGTSRRVHKQRVFLAAIRAVEDLIHNADYNRFETFLGIKLSKHQGTRFEEKENVMKKLSVVVVAIGILTVGITGCGTKVQRTEIDKVVDFSGRWNDTDARMVAEEMISEALAGNWLAEFNKAEGKDPVVIVGTVLNRTHEHINTDVFVQDLERALTNSGRVRFVSSKTDREEVREEREDQQLGNTEASTVTAKGHETGADFMLKGSINDVKDAVKGKYAVLYQANLELVDLRTNEKKWYGQKKIKKIVTRPQMAP
jgi:penicillin-binding protein activator